MLTGALAGARELADRCSSPASRCCSSKRNTRQGRFPRRLARCGGGHERLVVDHRHARRVRPVLGLTLWADGATDAGRVWFERGGQALASVGNNTSLANLAETHVVALAANSA